MAAKFFNFFRRGGNQNHATNQTLIVSERVFTYGPTEIQVAHQNLRSIYEIVIKTLKLNDTKSQATNNIIEKIYEELSSLGTVALKLKEQIDKDEEHVAERKQNVAKIREEIQRVRKCLDKLKAGYGLNEWIERNKDINSRVEIIREQKLAIESETGQTCRNIARLFENVEEKDDEIQKLQDLRDVYMESHQSDLDDFQTRQEQVLQKRRLFSIQPMEKTREMIFIFSSKVTDLDDIRDQIIQIRATRKLREQEIGTWKLYWDTLNERNDELMFRVLQDQSEILKIKNIEPRLPIEYQ